MKQIVTAMALALVISRDRLSLKESTQRPSKLLALQKKPQVS